MEHVNLVYREFQRFFTTLQNEKYITYIPSSMYQGYLVHFPAQAQKNPKNMHPFYFQKWNFLALVLKKLNISSNESFSYIFSKESFSYISRDETMHFSAQARKIKKIHPRKISYTSVNGNLETCSYVSGNRDPEKNFLCFRKLKSKKNF